MTHLRAAPAMLVLSLLAAACHSSSGSDAEPSPVRGPATIPDLMARGGSASLRFLCDPIGGEGLPVSATIAVEPGDVVELVIPSS